MTARCDHRYQLPRDGGWVCKMCGAEVARQTAAYPTTSYPPQHFPGTVVYATTGPNYGGVCSTAAWPLDCDD